MYFHPTGSAGAVVSVCTRQFVDEQCHPIKSDFSEAGQGDDIIPLRGHTVHKLLML